MDPQLVIARFLTPSAGAEKPPSFFGWYHLNIELHPKHPIEYRNIVFN